MKLSILPLIAVLLLSGGLDMCRANLGETEQQCISRYGNETGVQDDLGYRQVGNRAATFELKKGTTTMDIKVTFLNGRSCHETYSNADSSHGLSEEQMKALLDSQSAGLKWRKVKSIFRTSGTDSGVTAGREDWQREDGTSAVFWLTGQADAQSVTGSVEISTRQYTVAQRFYDQQNGDR